MNTKFAHERGVVTQSADEYLRSNRRPKIKRGFNEANESHKTFNKYHNLNDIIYVRRVVLYTLTHHT